MRSGEAIVQIVAGAERDRELGRLGAELPQRLGREVSGLSGRLAVDEHRVAVARAGIEASEAERRREIVVGVRCTLDLASPAGIRLRMKLHRHAHRTLGLHPQRHAGHVGEAVHDRCSQRRRGGGERKRGEEEVAGGGATHRGHAAGQDHSFA
jgi:hypothetical protein